MTVQRKKHWEKYWTEFSVDAATRATYFLTAQIASNFIQASFGKGKLCILDLGCGRGDIARLLYSFLSQSGYNVRIIGVDISAKALYIFCESNAHNLCAVLGDASRLPFRDEIFDVVVSFGYASVASYMVSEIQREIHRILKPTGILICDFRNILSLYFVLLKPHWIFKHFRRFLGFEKPSYHFGTLGIKRYFAQFHLNLRKVVFTNSFPPVSADSLEKLLKNFDRLVNRMRLGRLLGRISIAAFEKGFASRKPEKTLSPSFEFEV